MRGTILARQVAVIATRWHAATQIDVRVFAGLVARIGALDGLLIRWS